MPARCTKVSFALPSVSRECGRLCVPWLKTETGVSIKFFEEPNWLFGVEILTTECSETPSATLKAAIEQRSAKYQPPYIRLPEDYKTRRRMSTLGYAQKFTRRPSLKLVAFR